MSRNRESICRNGLPTSDSQNSTQPCGSIPPGTRQVLNLSDVAVRLGISRVTAKRWWYEGRLIGCVAMRTTRSRVLVPIEVVEFYLRYLELPTKLDLFEARVLSKEFLLELTGPDGGLSERGADAGEGRSATSGSR